MQSLFRRLIPDPFILTLVATVVLAALFPARGVVAEWVDRIATVAIMLLFFFYGAKIPREAVVDAVRHWRLHLTIVVATFLLFPLLGLGLRAAMPGMLTPLLWTGVLFLCVLPSTVQSSIVFTSIAGGNVAGAIAAASASNLLGVAVTPTLAGLLTHGHGAATGLRSIGAIATELLLPFVAGQILHTRLAPRIERHRRLVGYSDRSAILLSVYSAFSAAVMGGLWSRVEPLLLVRLLLVCLLLLTLVLALTRAAGRILGFAREDQIAILFCGSKKSLVAGIPMAKILFSGPDAGLVLLPLMLFHQIQLMACAAIANGYARLHQKA